jgi:hypothetical protein
MSEREMRRAAVLAQVKSKAWTLMEASERMELSYRQTKRLWKCYQSKGAKGLVHGNAGRSSNRSKPKKVRRKVLRLIRQKYSGVVGERFGPTLACEHLASEDSLELSATTVRRWMLAEGLWSRERKVRLHRQRRDRREHFGELVQMDGSFHEWLEKRGPRGCLMNLVDDATSTTLCRMGEQETIWAAVGVLRAWMEKYGVPRALYTDWKNVYVREPTVEGVFARNACYDAVWTHVRAAGYQDHRGGIAGGQGQSRAQSWHASGSAGEEDAAQEDRYASGGE